MKTYVENHFETGRYAHLAQINIPRIRNFQSLMTDDEFRQVGLKVASSPKTTELFLHPVIDEAPVESESFLLSDASYSYVFNSISTQRRQSALERLDTPSSAIARGISKENLEVLKRRISSLKNEALEEGIPVNIKSFGDARKWLISVDFRTFPRIFLLNGGELRVFWKNEDRQVGIHFLGDFLAQVVAIRAADGSERLYGTVKVSEVLPMIEAFGMNSLLG